VPEHHSIPLQLHNISMVSYSVDDCKLKIFGIWFFNSCIDLGLIDQPLEALTENFKAILNAIDKKFPGGVENLRSIELIFGKLPQLPVYVSTGMYVHNLMCISIYKFFLFVFVHLTCIYISCFDFVFILLSAYISHET